ncbi:hypothetical protein JQ559_17660 [Bradyrhizobium viridifuturi]|uniref:hypothetical protein n=1 Tax=Bradyrhizobium TaxID=374 RepID=UPI0003965788|nr:MULTISPECIES: hypothetical protein [Bradyrhizobium]ERF81215.1 MAG: hypothetical protein C207_05619 [Bradyrhizobium sp. DFCI-1]QRI71760.1 hypothetical protein JQ507_09915 [Bradyrhizobium sp. PSBB068]MBR1024546.1 hypothetical protein [Bradyrhizobium viridifuturi]MBR1038593.1 hypothetical protein [Bradyrhizobium viridifuturi]MBR1045481.1 hypothetical protein [Bradyrhizobium viridifuturi]
MRAAVTQPKENAAPLRGRRKPLTQYWNLLLVFAVVLGVMPACFGVVMLGMARMAMGAVRVMRRLLVIALFVVLGGFAVMTRRVLVMLGCLVVMLNACVVAHDDLPVWRVKSAIFKQER